mgnify:CR=1 FL=1
MARKTRRDDDWILVVDNAMLFKARTVAHVADSAEVTLGQVFDALHLSRKSLKTLFEDRLIFLNNHKAQAYMAVAIGDEIRLAMPKEKIDHEAIDGDLTILYEDYDLLIVDKPAGLTVNSPGQVSLANLVSRYFRDKSIKRKVRFLNRLDRDTSGCIVIAKSGLAQSYYQGQMEKNAFEKWYRATVQGHLDPTGDDVLNTFGSAKGVDTTDICDVKTRQCYTTVQFEFPMGRSQDGIHYEVQETGKYTRTDYRVVDFASMTLDNGQSLETSQVDVQLFTGRTHQIRVAFSYIGHPLVGDVLYGGIDTGKPFALRAVKVKFKGMRDGQVHVVVAE